jgi:type III pantothenate kinase
MLLALDIGNTNLTAGLWDGEDLVAQWRQATRRNATSDELAGFLFVAMQATGRSFGPIRGVAISSVVPSLTQQAAKMSRDYFHQEALVVGHNTDTGLKNAYEDPRAVGADRLVNALAAWVKYGQACVIADFGTATTVDAVSSDGTYLGGAIAPGIGISTDALFHAAAKLPRVELVAPSRALARNTTESIQSGLVYGYAGLTRELITRCVAEIEEPCKVLATGGLAELIAPLVDSIEQVEPHLTLEGLRLLWERR